MFHQNNAALIKQMFDIYLSHEKYLKIQFKPKPPKYIYWVNSTVCTLSLVHSYIESCYKKIVKTFVMHSMYLIYAVKQNFVL